MCLLFKAAFQSIKERKWHMEGDQDGVFVHVQVEKGVEKRAKWGENGRENSFFPHGEVKRWRES